MSYTPNIGTRVDHTRNNRPVCEECILAAEPGKLKTYRKIRNPKKPCWSCAEMIEEAEVLEQIHSEEMEAMIRGMK